MKILWIDDDNIRLNEMKEAFEDYGYSVDVFTDPSKGITHLKKNSSAIDIIILDILMDARGLFDNKKTNNGRKTGLLIYKEIRKMFKTPIILFTVLRDIRLIESYIKDDPNTCYITKPTPVENIISEIKGLVQ